MLVRTEDHGEEEKEVSFKNWNVFPAEMKRTLGLESIVGKI